MTGITATKTLTKGIARSVVLLGLTLTATTACVMDKLKTASAGHTGCTPDQLTISNHQSSLTGETWNATCNDKVYLCSGVMTGNSSEDFSCAPVAK
jgi:hypothetical protein